MSISPLLVSWKVNFNINDSVLTNFKSGDVSGSTISAFTQAIGASMVVPDGTVDEQISADGLEYLQVMFFYADQAMLVKLVPQGSTLASTPGLLLMPGMPSLISVQNVQQIYVSNTSGQIGKVIFQAAGI